MCVYVVVSRARQLVETFVGPVKKRRENSPAHSFPDPAGLFRAGRSVDRNWSDGVETRHLFDTFALSVYPTSSKTDREKHTGFVFCFPIHYRSRRQISHVSPPPPYFARFTSKTWSLCISFDPNYRLLYDGRSLNTSSELMPVDSDVFTRKSFWISSNRFINSAPRVTTTTAIGLTTENMGLSNSTKAYNCL